MTKAIAGLIIVAALAYVLIRVTFYVSGLWQDRQAARREVERLRAERMPLVQDRRPGDGD